MQKRYKIWTNIFFLIVGLSILNYIFRVIPNFKEILSSDEQFWDIASTGEKIQKIGYYFGYLFPWSIFIFWLIKSYFKPENVLKRKGYKQELKNLNQLLKSNSISREEYDNKLEKIETQNLEQKAENEEKFKTAKSEQKLEKEYKTLLELKDKGILTQEEFEYKEAVIELEKNGNKFNNELIEKLVNKYDFEHQNKEEYLSEVFNPKMQDRTTDELISVLKSNGYKPSAKYQAYVEIKTRNTTANTGYM